MKLVPIEGLDLCFVYALLYKFIDAHIVYQWNRRIPQDHNYIVFSINKVTEQTSWDTNPCHTKNMLYVSFVTGQMRCILINIFADNTCPETVGIYTELAIIYVNAKSHKQYAWALYPLHNRDS